MKSKKFEPLHLWMCYKDLQRSIYLDILAYPYGVLHLEILKGDKWCYYGSIKCSAHLHKTIDSIKKFPFKFRVVHTESLNVIT